RFLRPTLQAVELVAFFFQAEDGIRVGHVTGVQTSALPISFLLEEEGPQPVERASSLERSGAGALGQVVESGEPGFGLEVGILDAGDRQRRPAEVDLPVGPPEEVTELAQRISSQGRDGSPPSR